MQRNSQQNKIKIKLKKIIIVGSAPENISPLVVLVVIHLGRSRSRKVEVNGQAGEGKGVVSRALSEVEVPPPRVADGRKPGASLVQDGQTEICHLTFQTRAQLWRRMRVSSRNGAMESDNDDGDGRGGTGTRTFSLLRSRCRIRRSWR